MARKKEKVKTVNELWSELQSEFVSTKPKPVRGGSGVAMIADAWERGEHVVLLKPLKWAGKKYKPGDLFFPEEKFMDRALRLAELGYMLSGNLSARNDRNRLLKKQMEAAQPKRDLFLRVMSKIDKSKGDLAAAKAAVRTATDEVRTLESQLAVVEAELREALEGVDIA